MIDYLNFVIALGFQNVIRRLTERSHLPAEQNLPNLEIEPTQKDPAAFWRFTTEMTVHNNNLKENYFPEPEVEPYFEVFMIKVY